MIRLCSCRVLGVCSSIRYTVLLWLLSMIFCNKLETAAQNDSSVIISSSLVVDNTTFTSFIDMLASVTPTLVSTASSPDISPVTSMDILTFTSLPLVPTGAIMTAPLPSVDTSTPAFVITITTTAFSPVDKISTSMTTTVFIASTIIMPVTTTTITTTTSSPVPEDDSGGFSLGVIVGIAAGGGTALLVILTIIICWACCYYHKRHQQKAIPIPMIMSPTIQVRPQQYDNWAYTSQISRNNWAYASQMSKASTTSNTSQLSRISKSLRDSFRRHKERNQVEGVKLISTASNTMLSTPV